MRNREKWPAELLHAELCAWRFGANAACDCGLDRTESAVDEAVETGDNDAAST